MDPLSAGLVGGTSLLGGVLNYFGQRSANAQALKNMREQNAFTRAMWDANNEYNTPVAQRRRYEQAGINPFLALGNIQAGNAQGVTTPSSAPVANEMEGLGSAFGTIGSAIMQSYQQTRLNDAQIDKLHAEAESIRSGTPYVGDEAQSRISLNKSKEDLNRSQSDLARAEIMFKEASIDRMKTLTPLEAESFKANASKLLSDSRLADVRVRIEEYELKHIKPAEAQLLKAQLSQAYANVAYLYTLGKLNNANVGLVLQQTMTEVVRRSGVRLDNVHTQKLIDNIDKNASSIRSLQGSQARSADANASYLSGKADREWSQIGISLVDNLMSGYGRYR